MIQTEQLGEKILSEQGFLQKSSVLTFTANLKQMIKINAHKIKPGGENLLYQTGFLLRYLLDLDHGPRQFVKCQFIFFDQR